MNFHVYGAVLTGVTEGIAEETTELAALLLVSMAAAFTMGVMVLTEAKEAAILEAISSALIDDVGVEEVEVTVVETAVKEELEEVATSCALTDGVSVVEIEVTVVETAELEEVATSCALTKDVGEVEVDVTLVETAAEEEVDGVIT